MRIYIRTPLVNKSKMIPHTVEHCAGNVCWNVSDFFDFSRWLDWEISIDYTCFIPDKWVKYEDVLEKIFQPIEKKKVNYEHKVLKEELSEPSYAQKLSEKILKKFVDPEISTNHYKSISWEEAKEYHEKYYKLENVIVVDEEKDYKVIFKWFSPEKKKCRNLEKRKEKFRYKGNKYILYFFKSYNAEEYRKMFFCYELIDSYLYFMNRLNKQQYYPLINYFFQNTYAYYILVEDTDYSRLDQDFFEQWKKYFLNMLKNWFYKEDFFLNEYFYGIPKNRKEVIQICKNFSRAEFKEFLELK